jgi:hypothetical protein
MKRIVCLVFIVSLFVSSACDDNSQGRLYTVEGNTEYLIVGSFYGFCVGDQCYKYLLIRDGKVFQLNGVVHNQATGITYSSLTELPAEQYEIVKDLPGSIPAQLLDVEETTLGCPDCADGGGLYVETIVDDTKRYWYIDNTLNEPAYLRPFIELVNARINQFRK